MHIYGHILSSTHLIRSLVIDHSNSPGSPVGAMFEAELRRLVLAADTVDIVDADPFGPEAAPRVAGSSAAACVPWLAVHHKQEAQPAVLPVPSVHW